MRVRARLSACLSEFSHSSTDAIHDLGEFQLNQLMFRITRLEPLSLLDFLRCISVLFVVVFMASAHLARTSGNSVENIECFATSCICICLCMCSEVLFVGNWTKLGEQLANTYVDNRRGKIFVL